MTLNYYYNTYSMLTKAAFNQKYSKIFNNVIFLFINDFLF